MRRPFASVVLVYMAGIILGCFYSPPPAWLFVLAAMLGLPALLSARLRPSLLILLLMTVGWLNLTLDTTALSPFDLRKLVGETIEEVTLYGRVSEIPVLHLSHRNGQPIWRTSVIIEASELEVGTHRQQAFGKVTASTLGSLNERFFIGQQIEIKGLIQRPRQRMAEGLFDYYDYLAQQNIYYQLTTQSTNQWRVVGDASLRPSLYEEFLNRSQTGLAHGLPEEDEALRLLWAMVLGWKTGLTDELSEPFMQNGTLHIFAISGLHIALIAGILVSLLRVLQLPRSICGLLVVPLIWFYTGATGWQPSAIRSTVMMTVIIAGWALNRPSDMINSLAASAFIILVWQPQQLFQAGFQLSFMVVLSLGLLSPIFDQATQRLLEPDPLLPTQLIPRWRRWLEAPSRHILKSLSTSLAACLGSLPLIAYYFYLVTPVSLLANLVIVPLSSFALMSSLGSLLFQSWLPPIADLFNHSSWFLMKSMVFLSDWTAALPFAYFYVPRPTFLQMMAFYAFIWCCLAWSSSPRKWKPWLLTGTIFLGVAGLWQWEQDRGVTSITIMPLGGSGIFVDAPGAANDLLIDCGDHDAAEYTIKSLLHSRGLSKLSHLILTHGDIHHVDGFEFLDDHFQISQIATSSVRFRSPAYRRVIERIEQSPTRWRRIQRNDSICGWRVLHPDGEDRFGPADDNSIVLHRNIEGLRLLLLSDLGHQGQSALMGRETDLKADVIITGVPGQGEPFNPNWIAALQPKAVIVADVGYLSYARAGRKLRETFRGINVPVFYTSETGAVTLTIGSGHWKLSSIGGVNLSFNTTR